MAHVHDPAAGHRRLAPLTVAHAHPADQHALPEIQLLRIVEDLDAPQVQPVSPFRPEAQRQPVRQVDEVLVLDLAAGEFRHPPIVAAGQIGAGIMHLVGLGLLGRAARREIAVAERAERLAQPLGRGIEGVVGENPAGRQPSLRSSRAGMRVEQPSDRLRTVEPVGRRRLRPGLRRQRRRSRARPARGRRPRRLCRRRNRRAAPPAGRARARRAARALPSPCPSRSAGEARRPSCRASCAAPARPPAPGRRRPRPPGGRHRRPADNARRPRSASARPARLRPAQARRCSMADARSTAAEKAAPFSCSIRSPPGPAMSNPWLPA